MAAITLKGLLFLLQLMTSYGNLPTFDEDSRMRILLLPLWTKTGSIVYRLRASDPDFDYPLTFQVLGIAGERIVRIDSIPCSRQHSVCEANVVLINPLEESRVYDFRLSVADTKGGTTTVASTIRVTNTSDTTPCDTFPYLNQFVSIPENAAVGSVADLLIARKNSMNSRGVHFEIKDSSGKFRLSEKLTGTDRSSCSIIVAQPLDFETQAVHVLRILVLNGYVNATVDSRNIVELNITVFVEDIQDSPPFFTVAPPVTAIADTLQPGSHVLQVKAQDGDKGIPRDVQYGIIADSNPFAPFFEMDPKTGEVRLRKPLVDLTGMIRQNEPFLLNIVAEEVGTDNSDNNSRTNISLAIFIEDDTNDEPSFALQSYVAYMEEDAPIGTALRFSDGQRALVTDSDLGQAGIFSLMLVNDNGTFDISPSVAENTAEFVIRLKNPGGIDYEKSSKIQFKIVAREVHQGSTKSSTADVTVYIIDINDNSPIFDKDRYSAEIMENVPGSSTVIRVKATDADSGTFGSIRYTAIYGDLAKAFNLDPVSGLITVASPQLLDRENTPEISLKIEARDEEGKGRATTVPLTIRLLDVNDNVPQFVNTLYEANLSPDLSKLTSKLIVQAIDKDSGPLNGQVRYEIVKGNYESKFRINEVTGEITLSSPLSPASTDPVITLQVRAYDLGIPHLHSQVPVHIYTQEVSSRNVYFLIPKSAADVEKDRQRVEAMLGALTGAPTSIQSVQSYKQDSNGLDGVADVERLGSKDSQKSKVVATVRYPPTAAVIDVELIKNELAVAESNSITVTKIEEYQYRNGVLSWVLLFICLLFLAVIIIIIICCYYPQCYYYRTKKERKISSGENGTNISTQNQSVRKEAWSADKSRTVQNSNFPRRGQGGNPGKIPQNPQGNSTESNGSYQKQERLDTSEIRPEDSASLAGEDAILIRNQPKIEILSLEENGSNREPSRNIVLNRFIHDSHNETRNFVRTIPEETESALERENQRKDNQDPEYNIAVPKQAWVPPDPTVSRSGDADPSLRDAPYFNNRSSMLRHKTSVKRTEREGSHKHIRKTSRNETDTESSSTDKISNSRPAAVRRKSSGQKAPDWNQDPDDDLDSGIALNGVKNSSSRKFLEKKSIFTIAYDDVKTTKLPNTSEESLPVP